MMSSDADGNLQVNWTVRVSKKKLSNDVMGKIDSFNATAFCPSLVNAGIISTYFHKKKITWESGDFHWTSECLLHILLIAIKCARTYNTWLIVNTSET